MRLVSGDNFDGVNFNIKDIAHSLSMICRWGGHTKTWHSVAEHSVRVCNELSGWDRCYGILHDAAEYIYGDLCSPLKKELPSYCAAINVLQRKIYRYFGLLDTATDRVRAADRRIKQWEYDNYVSRFNVGWSQESSRLRFLYTFNHAFGINSGD